MVEYYHPFLSYQSNTVDGLQNILQKSKLSTHKQNKHDTINLLNHAIDNLPHYPSSFQNNSTILHNPK